MKCKGLNWAKNWELTYHMATLAKFVYLLLSEYVKNFDPHPSILFVLFFFKPPKDKGQCKYLKIEDREILTQLSCI